MPTIERDVVRLVVLDASERILLLHVRDLSNPEFGTAWELPGGGLEPGETYIQAAIRELYEETGLEVHPECIDPPTWHRDVTYVYRNARRNQHELIAAARLKEMTPSIRGQNRNATEKEDLLGAEWWSVQNIATAAERFYPRSLPLLLPAFLRGDVIREPLEIWS